MLQPKQFAQPYTPPLIGGNSGITGTGINAINGQGVGTPGLWAQQKKRQMIDNLRDPSSHYTQQMDMQLMGAPLQEEEGVR